MSIRKQSSEGADHHTDVRRVNQPNPAGYAATQYRGPGYPKSRFSDRTVRWFRKAGFFLRREQVRRAWMIFAASVAFASLPWAAHLHELRQGAIVLASIAAAAIFMPELNSGLWKLDADELRDTIPVHQRRAFYLELIRADCPDDRWAQRWAEVVWRRGLMPLLDAATNPSLIRWNMTYDIDVHLNKKLNIAGQEMLMTAVETRIDAERVLPAVRDHILWVSICGNQSSLLEEFRNSNCLVRELVELPVAGSGEWAAEVQRLCHIRARIGPRSIVFGPDDVVTISGDRDLRLVRWMIPVTEAECNGGPVSFQLEMNFPIEAESRSFPVIFAGYYCAGRTTMSFRLYRNDGPKPNLRWRYSEDAHNSTGIVRNETDWRSHEDELPDWRPDQFDTPERQSVIYRTPPDALLWPGAGIYLWWDFRS